jgi:mRNA interferase MazF
VGRSVRHDWLDGVKRGDVVVMALQGEQARPPSALVVQSDLFSHLPAVTLLPITSTLVDAMMFRMNIEASPRNGLAVRSHIMVDKPQRPARGMIGAVIGHADDAIMPAVNRAMAVFLDLAVATLHVWTAPGMQGVFA